MYAHDAWRLNQRRGYLPLILHLHLYNSPPPCCASAETPSEEEEIAKVNVDLHDSGCPELVNYASGESEEQEEEEEDEKSGSDGFISEDEKPIRDVVAAEKKKQKPRQQKPIVTQQARMQTPSRTKRKLKETTPLKKGN